MLADNLNLLFPHPFRELNMLYQYCKKFFVIFVIFLLAKSSFDVLLFILGYYKEIKNIDKTKLKEKIHNYLVDLGHVHVVNEGDESLARRWPVRVFCTFLHIGLHVSLHIHGGCPRGEVHVQ